VNDLTTLLAQWNAGSQGAGEAVVSKTYEELRRLARGYLRRERSGHTLQATALLNEVYLRLLPEGPRAAATREEFFRLMASEMRRRLVDHARRRLAEKRGGGARHDTLDTLAPIAAPETSADAHALLDRLDRAIDQLAISYPRTAQVVQLRFMGGLTIEEIAEDLELSAGTVKREWTFAKAWLAAALTTAGIRDDRREISRAPGTTTTPGPAREADRRRPQQRR
jgi:RNA polymerase sigma factor (TIGR02999 family)